MGYGGLDIEAISGILGSISIACWVVVFSPQIIENYSKKSADGLSIEFIIIWLGMLELCSARSLINTDESDFIDHSGRLFQHGRRRSAGHHAYYGKLLYIRIGSPLLTKIFKIILAIYYTLADIVLLLQCFYYRGFTFRDPKPDAGKSNHVENGNASERTPLVADGSARGELQRALSSSNTNGATSKADRTRSESSYRDRFNSLNGTMLSPATPMHPEETTTSDPTKPSKPRTWAQAILFNSTAILLVIIAGIAGYYLSPSPKPHNHHDKHTDADDQASTLHFSLWGQIFGYICAVLYLGSRIPQILLNRRRQSTEGLNALFFLFACLGNLTFVLSIFAFEPICSKRSHGHWRERNHCKPGEHEAIYARYILVNLSWLIGSAGTLVLDFAVFAQFFMYRNNVASLDDTTPVDAIPRTIDGEGRGREPNER
jgi:uncharacterized protein with PQ loop repeat